MPQYIDLNGPSGNAFALLGLAKMWAKQLDLNFEEIREEMTSGGYEDLLDAFDKHFGEFFEWNRETMYEDEDY